MWLHSLLTSVVDGGEWSGDRPGRFISGKEPWYPLDILQSCNPPGRGSLVGIATVYWLEGPVIESRLGGVRFSALVQTGPGTNPAY